MKFKKRAVNVKTDTLEPRYNTGFGVLRKSVSKENSVIIKVLYTEVWAAKPSFFNRVITELCAINDDVIMRLECRLLKVKKTRSIIHDLL